MTPTIEAMKQAHAVLQSGDLLCEVTAASIMSAAIAAEEAQGVRVIAWLVQCKSSGLVEQAEPHEKATNPEQWTDAFPVFTHPALPPTGERAALIAKLRDMPPNPFRMMMWEAADMLAADARSVDWKEKYLQMVDEAEGLRLQLHDSAQQVEVPQGLPRIHVTEEMHRAALKVLHRASGLDGLPQRMMNAMLAAAPQSPQADAPTAHYPEDVLAMVPMTRDQVDDLASDGCFLGNIYEITEAVEQFHKIGVKP